MRKPRFTEVKLLAPNHTPEGGTNLENADFSLLYTSLYQEVWNRKKLKREKS